MNGKNKPILCLVILKLVLILVMLVSFFLAQNDAAAEKYDDDVGQEEIGQVNIEHSRYDQRH